MSPVRFVHPVPSVAQNNSTTEFANFDSFGNASVPSHFGTSPPSKPSLQQPHTGTTPCPIYCVLCSRVFLFPVMVVTECYWLNITYVTAGLLTELYQSFKEDNG